MHILKEAFMDELADWERKAKQMDGTYFSNADADRIHLITDLVKNIDKIEYLENESGYASNSEWMSDSRTYGTSYRGYDDGYSYARMGRGRGSNARRDSMGRYSSKRSDVKDHLIFKADEMLEMAEAPEQRKAIESFKHKLENMM